MEAITAAKLAAVAAKNKETVGKGILIVGATILIPLFLLVLCFLKLISAFAPNGAVSSSESYDVTQTAIYNTVKEVTEAFYEEIRSQMNAEKERIMEQYTEEITLMDEKGNEYIGQKCDAIVTRKMNYLCEGYLIAYLSCKREIDLDTAVINKKLAKNFLESICSITVTEGGYREFEIANTYLDETEIAEKYFDSDSQKKEFITSCQAYGEFFNVSETEIITEAGNYTDVDFTSAKLMEVPLYLQYKQPWAGMSYGNGNIKKNGCCPTCLAMVFSYLRQENIYPDDITRWSGNRYYVNGQGTAWNIFNDIGDWGIKASNIGKSQSALIQALKDGKPVIASMGPGTFTKGGHFIVLSGITATGKIKVNDPNDSALKNHKNKDFDIALILRESKNMWVFEVAG